MQLTTEMEKSLALLQETDDLVWFTTGTGDGVKIWEGSEEGMRENWGDYLMENEGIDVETLSFEEWLEDNGTEVDVEEYDEYGDWKVYTDTEADDAWEESLDSYLDDCILPALPKALQCYFDRESWKSDARMDGRGHSLSGYDGNECEQEVNGTTYYLYRQN
jgi:hypothetical protein